MKKIFSYQKLDEAVIEVLKKKKEPITASKIASIIENDYKIINVRVSPKKIARRNRKNPNIKKIENARHFFYFLD